ELWRLGIECSTTSVQSLPIPLIRFIVLSEALGAVGLILPMASGIAPSLTVFAALGLAVIMVLGAGVHRILREPRNVTTCVVIRAVCLLVAFGRGLRVTVI